MNLPEPQLLSPEQVDYLEAYQEVLDALLEITEQADFKSVFGEMLPGEMVSRYVNTLNFDGNYAWEHDIGERYRQIKQDESQGGTLADWDNDLDTLEAKYRK